MWNFIIETFKPEIFWTALAALGTLSAVLTALFLPTYHEYKRVKKIKRLIDEEIFRNYQIARNLTLTMQRPDGVTVDLDPQEAVRALNFDLWKEYRYKLADDSPESFKKYQYVNQIIVDLPNFLIRLPNAPKNVTSRIFQDTISSFIKKCREELKFS